MNIILLSYPVSKLQIMYSFMLAYKELDLYVKFCSPLTLKKYTTSKILKCLIQMHIILYTEPNRIIIYDKEIRIDIRSTVSAKVPFWTSITNWQSIRVQSTSPRESGEKQNDTTI